MNLDPNWSLHEAFVQLSNRFQPGSMHHGATRNRLLEVWGQLVGRNRARAELNTLVERSGSRSAFTRDYSISWKSLARLSDHYDQLPREVENGKFKTGDQIGPWKLLRKLGTGGNASVWRASSIAHGEVALKVPLGKKRLLRFTDEIRIHKSIANVAGVMPCLATSASSSNTSTESPWIAMPIAKLIEDEVRRRDDHLFVLKGIASLSNTLANLHKKGISHRDIKPNNIFYLKRWVLSDFGIASFPGKTPITKNGKKLGPLYYISPEMLNSPEEANGPAADVYSLAKTLWVLLSGQSYPPPGEQRVSEPALCISNYVKLTAGNELDVLIEASTRHDPSERPSARAFSDRLKAMCV